MPYFGLRIPVIAIFIGPLIFQISSLVYLFIPPINFILVSMIEKIYLSAILFGFFYCIREIIFFESLFKTDYVNNAPAFTSESREHDEFFGRFGSEVHRTNKGSIIDERRRNL